MRYQPRLYSIYLDHHVLGCGERDFLVLKTGRKWVKLLCVAIMTPIKMPAAEFKTRIALLKPVKCTTAGLARRLRQNAATYETSKALLREAIAASKRDG